MVTTEVFSPHAQRFLFQRLLQKDLPAIILLCGAGSGALDKIKEVVARADFRTSDNRPYLHLDVVCGDGGKPQFVRKDVSRSVLHEKRPVFMFCDDPRMLPSIAMQINRFMPGAPLVSVNMFPNVNDGQSQLSYQWRLSNGPASREKQSGTVGLDAELEHFRNLIAQLGQRAIENACEYAREVLSQKPVSLANEAIPPAVSALVRERLKLPDRPLQDGYVCILKGGTAAAIYLGEGSRPVSMDVDFCTHGLLPHVAVERVMSALSVVDYTAQGVPTAGIGRDRITKSTKWSGTMNIGQEPVDVDLVPVRRVTKLGFCFRFEYDGYLHYMRREVVYQSGERAFVIPPELLLAEKLAASRGRSEGKWDLYDIAGLLVTQRIDYSVLTHLIDVQRFSTATDEALTPLSADSAAHVLESNLRLRGFKDSRLIELIAKKISGVNAGGQTNDGHLQLLNGHDLKKLALVDIYLITLAKIIAELNDESRKNEAHSIAGRFESQKVQAAVAKLRKALISYASHQVGTLDTYVRQD